MSFTNQPKVVSALIICTLPIFMSGSLGAWLAHQEHRTHEWQSWWLQGGSPALSLINSARSQSDCVPDVNFHKHSDHIIKGLTGEICHWETESSGACFEPVVKCLGEELGGWKVFPKDQGFWQRSDCRSRGSCIWLRTEFYVLEARVEGDGCDLSYNIWEAL